MDSVQLLFCLIVAFGCLIGSVAAMGAAWYGYDQALAVEASLADPGLVLIRLQALRLQRSQP